MFFNPIKRSPFKNLDEVKEFSWRVGRSGDTKVYCETEGQIVFCDEDGIEFVTPFRNDVITVLKEAKYKQDEFLKHFFREEEKPDSYKWLEKIAEEENWAETYEKANEIATDKKFLGYLLKI